MAIIYLAGPIAGCDDHECKDWRDILCTTYASDHKFLNPLRRDYRGRERGNIPAIIQLDKKDIRQCDLMLVNFTRPSVGTSMEMFYAYTLDKPIIVVHKYKGPTSPWLTYHATAILNTIGDAMDWIGSQFDA